MPSIVPCPLGLDDSHEGLNSWRLSAIFEAMRKLERLALILEKYLQFFSNDLGLDTESETHAPSDDEAATSMLGAASTSECDPNLCDDHTAA